jgi:hypothetical protein
MTASASGALELSPCLGFLLHSIAVGPQPHGLAVVAVCTRPKEEIVDQHRLRPSSRASDSSVAGVRSLIAAVAAALGTFALPNDAGAQFQGPSTLQTPYIVPSAAGVITKSIITNGNGTSTPDEVYPKTGGGTYRWVGIPDGLGWYDNGDNTFTLLSNHELPGTGIVRDHGSKGAVVSEWGHQQVEPLGGRRPRLNADGQSLERGQLQRGAGERRQRDQHSDRQPLGQPRIQPLLLGRPPGGRRPTSLSALAAATALLTTRRRRGA